MPNQKGFTPLLLILLAALGILLYVLISSTFPFKDKLFNLLYPKPSSNAQEVAAAVPDEIIVKFKAGVKEDQGGEKGKDHIRKSHGLTKKHEIPELGVEIVTVNPNDKDQTIEELKKDPRIKYAEANYIAKALEIPNDPEYVAGRQWSINKLNLPQAYDISQGSSSAVVAVLDTGTTIVPDLEGY